MIFLEASLWEVCRFSSLSQISILGYPICVCAWASYQIRKIAGCACAGNAGNVFPRRRFQRKLLVSDPGMHHGTCVTHVPWCMSGSLTCGDGENVPGIPGACAPAVLRIWQEAHATHYLSKPMNSVLRRMYASFNHNDCWRVNILKRSQETHIVSICHVRRIYFVLYLLLSILIPIRRSFINFTVGNVFFASYR